MAAASPPLLPTTILPANTTATVSPAPTSVSSADANPTLGGLIVASAFVVFLTSVGSLIFSALALGAAIVCAHGAFRIPEDLFLDEPDQANGAASVNLLSFITSATGGRV
uniref:PRA1 family protein n=1 Tax=Oryza glumipatula TaxID=40148 RepID=A0A0E0BMQ5_9ORYZ